jgi:hypothetical protein
MRLTSLYGGRGTFPSGANSVDGKMEDFDATKYVTEAFKVWRERVISTRQLAVDEKDYKLIFDFEIRFSDTEGTKAFVWRSEYHKDWEYGFYRGDLYRQRLIGKLEPAFMGHIIELFEGIIQKFNTDGGEDAFFRKLD